MRFRDVLAGALLLMSTQAVADEKLQRLDAQAEAAVDELLSAPSESMPYRRVNTVVNTPGLGEALAGPPKDTRVYDITGDIHHQADVLLGLVNQARAEVGCGPLTINAQLMQAAQRQSVSMSEKNYVYHYTDDGVRLKHRIGDTGYAYTLLGENVAAGQKTAEIVFHEWMTSPGHRANILNCGYEEMGVGYVHDPQDGIVGTASVPYYFYWTQVFGRHMKLAGK